MRRFELVECSPCYSLVDNSIFTAPRALMATTPFPPRYSFFEDEVDFALDLLRFPRDPLFFISDFEAVTDLIRIPFRRSVIRVGKRRSALEDIYLQSLSDRVSALELGLNRLIWDEDKAPESKYTWTAEIKSPEKERKYKWVTEKKGAEKSYTWKAGIKDNGAIERTYTLKVNEGGKNPKKSEKEVKKGKGKSYPKPRIVEIEEPPRHAAIVLRQAFTKNVEKKMGKRKELSSREAASLIQKTFRAYLIRRSQALRALRELAVAKNKLKEIRALFNNFTYRRRLSRDAEERQRFSEKIIVLLLTVDAIEGADLMVRAAKKSMVDELEALLDSVDPQPAGKYLSTRRRTFDMPDPVTNAELAAGVARVVEMLDDQDAI